MKKNYIILGFCLILLVTVVSFSIFSARSVDLDDENLETFAQCLSERGVKMYGAYWCSHCQNQKRLFGNAFKFIQYVECTQETKKCLDANVNGYPTWIFADGSRLEGEVSLLRLSEKSGCFLQSQAL